MTKQLAVLAVRIVNINPLSTVILPFLIADFFLIRVTNDFKLSNDTVLRGFYYCLGLNLLSETII